ncbi:MAG: phytanoyl-CoA dioxygenase family protein [Pseudomonadota bacterium]
MNTPLPERPSLDSLKYQAKQLLKRHHAGDVDICDALRRLNQWTDSSNNEILAGNLTLADAQFAIALQYGFPGWSALKAHVMSLAKTPGPDKSVTFTAAQREEFKHRGLLRVPGLLPADIVTPVREMVREVLERADVCRNGIWTAGRQNGLADMALKGPLLKKLKSRTKRSPELIALSSIELHDAAEQLVDGRKLMTWNNDCPQILFTPPDAEHWELPHKVWHMDVPRFGKIGCPGVQMFTFIERVEHGGAGTVVAAGSHHYLNDRGKVKSGQVKRILRQTHPWFKNLLKPSGGSRQHFLEAPTQDGDIELQVVELTGEPGDVWLMDLRLLHSLSPNISDRPRLMATQRYFLTEVANAANHDSEE